MRRPARILAAVAMTAACAPVPAAVRNYGRREVKSPLWAEGLEALVNSPLRVDGRSSLGMTEFYFDGNDAQVNELIAGYAGIDAPRTVYLTVNVGMDHDATLQIQHHGDRCAFLTVNVRSATALSALKLPADVNIEALPAILKSIEPDKAAAEQRLWEQVQTAVKQRADADRD